MPVTELTFVKDNSGLTLPPYGAFEAQPHPPVEPLRVTFSTTTFFNDSERKANHGKTKRTA
jgi:hypothetical protein